MQLTKSRIFSAARGVQLDNGVTSPWSRRKAIVQATSMCAGNARKPRTCPWSLALNVEEVDCRCESPHVHGDCRYRVAYSRHLPLWSRPTNKAYACKGKCCSLLEYGFVWNNTSQLCKNQTPRKIGVRLGSIHHERVQAHQGEGEEMT